MILGYTLTNIPQKFNNGPKQQRRTSTKLRAITEEGPCIKIGGKIRTAGFLHREETTEQNKEGGNSQPSK